MKIVIEGNHPLFKNMNCVFDLDKPNVEQYEANLASLIECAELGGFRFSVKRSSSLNKLDNR